LSKGRELLSKDRVTQRLSLSPDLLQEAILAIEIAANGKGQEAGDAGEVTGTSSVPDGGLDPETTNVWFAGKKMDGGKLIQDYLGRNEKTKAVVKLQEAGGLKPAREPHLDDAGEKEMMAWHFKKQQQQKMVEADSEEFTTSPWASSLALKQQMGGLQNIRLS